MDGTDYHGHWPGSAAIHLLPAFLSPIERWTFLPIRPIGPIRPIPGFPAAATQTVMDDTDYHGHSAVADSCHPSHLILKVNFCFIFFAIMIEFTVELY